MSNVRRSLIALALSSVLGSCLSIARVSEDELAKPVGWAAKVPCGPSTAAKRTCVPGIPFYATTERYRQTTEYLQSAEQVTLRVEHYHEVTKASDVKIVPIDTQDFVRYVASRGDQKLLDVQSALAKLGPRDGPQDVIDLFLALPAAQEPLLPHPPTKPLQIASANSVEPFVTVDYSRKYYLNEVLPWLGKSTFTPELAPGGTLNKVSMEVENKTPKALEALFPIKELLSQKLLSRGPTSDEKASMRGMGFDVADATFEVKTRVTLSVTTVGYRYVFTRVWSAPYDDEKGRAPLKFDLEQEFKRVPFGFEPEPTPVKKNDSKNAINFSGSVTLPESPAAPASEAKKTEQKKS